MARKRKSQRRKRNGTKSSDYFLITILMAVLLAIVAGVTFLFMNKEEILAYNSDDLCPEIGARATVAILLDTTDEISIPTKRDIQNRAQNELESLPRYYRLSLYTMDEAGLDPEPIVTLCNPGQLSEMGDLAQKGITANPRMIERKYNDFEASISDATDRILNTIFEGKQSPLLGALQELSLILQKPTDLQIDQYTAGRNKIIFISDLMEHTDTFSIYESGVNLKAFQNSRATEKFGKNYTEDLEFWVIQRDQEALSSRKIMNFWGKKILEGEFGYPASQILKMIPLIGEV